jgi:NAD(P)H-hydrate epimerase
MAKKRKPESSSFIPVVIAQEMARIEQMAVDEGCSEEKFMAEAGRKVALAALEWIEREKIPKRVVLLIGKGNNGGDAFAAGIELLEEGVRVEALALYEPKDCSELNRKFRDRFLKRRGAIGAVSYEEAGLIVDGFLGTGFKGKVDPKMGAEIERANGSGKPILAIDIPSGLDGTSGEVRGPCIRASETIALGLPKAGFFLRGGWNHVGRLRIEDFGLPKKFVEKGECFGWIPDLAKLKMPPMARNRHKYQAGYVVGLGGSEVFRGAPKMAGMAALRTGAGIVRIFHKEEIGEAPLELICQKWSEKEWRAELKRAQAAFIGPGMGKKAMRWSVDLPVVLDADAIQEDMDVPKRAILTPHRGEALRLLGLKKDTLEEDLLARCQKWAVRKGAILVLKGAPTFIFSTGRPPVIVPHGDPGMATAGSGDVLTGILAGLLAQKMGCFEAAVLGVSLHALAGEEAAKEMTSYGLTASDLIAFLPKAIQKIR